MTMTQLVNHYKSYFDDGDAKKLEKLTKLKIKDITDSKNPIESIPDSATITYTDRGGYWSWAYDSNTNNNNYKKDMKQETIQDPEVNKELDYSIYDGSPNGTTERDINTGDRWGKALIREMEEQRDRIASTDTGYVTFNVGTQEVRVQHNPALNAPLDNTDGTAPTTNDTYPFFNDAWLWGSTKSESVTTESKKETVKPKQEYTAYNDLYWKLNVEDCCWEIAPNTTGASSYIFDAKSYSLDECYEIIKNDYEQ